MGLIFGIKLKCSRQSAKKLFPNKLRAIIPHSYRFVFKAERSASHSWLNRDELQGFGSLFGEGSMVCSEKVRFNNGISMHMLPCYWHTWVSS